MGGTKPDNFPVVFVGTYGSFVFESPDDKGRYYSFNGWNEPAKPTYWDCCRKAYRKISIEEFVLMKLEEE